MWFKNSDRTIVKPSKFVYRISKMQVGDIGYLQAYMTILSVDHKGRAYMISDYELSTTPHKDGSIIIEKTKEGYTVDIRQTMRPYFSDEDMSKNLYHNKSLPIHTLLYQKPE